MLESERSTWTWTFSTVSPVGRRKQIDSLERGLDFSR